MACRTIGPLGMCQESLVASWVVCRVLAEAIPLSEVKTHFRFEPEVPSNLHRGRGEIVFQRCAVPCDLSCL